MPEREREFSSRRYPKYGGAFGRWRDAEARPYPVTNLAALKTGEYSSSRRISFTSPCTPTIIVGTKSEDSRVLAHFKIPWPSPVKTIASAEPTGT
jgi:hypothetical protein